MPPHTSLRLSTITLSRLTKLPLRWPGKCSTRVTAAPTTTSTYGLPACVEQDWWGNRTFNLLLHARDVHHLFCSLIQSYFCIVHCLDQNWHPLAAKHNRDASFFCCLGDGRLLSHCDTFSRSSTVTYAGMPSSVPDCYPPQPLIAVKGSCPFRTPR